MDRIRQLAVHLQVEFMGLTLLGLMLIVVAVGVGAAMRVEGAIQGVAGRDVPAALMLLQLERGAFEAQLALEQSFDNEDLHLRDQRLVAYARNATSLDQVWAAFGETPANEPGEADLRRTFDVDHAAWTEATVVLATLSRQEIPAGDPETRTLIERSRELSSAMSSSLARLMADFHEPVIQASLREVQAKARMGRITLLALLGAALLLGVGVLRVGVRATRRQENEIAERDRERECSVVRREFESRINRAFEMAQKENEALSVVSRALIDAAPGAPCELLLAETSGCRFQHAAGSEAEDVSICRVSTPRDCAAVRRGYALSFDSSEALDACPHLRGRNGGACSAHCAPVTVGGATVGVLHATGPDHDPPDAATTRSLAYLAARTGERLGYIRAFHRSEEQASTDSLTGLLNRRSLRERVRQLAPDQKPFAVAYGDLDHFKRLNDNHGHEAGDRALVLFARVIREATKRGDICARWGGEEFVVMLPGCTVTNAKQAIDRTREALAEALSGSSLPPFTVSFGVADSRQSEDLDALLAVADQALLAAKRAGRDQVVMAGSEPAAKEDAEDAEHPEDFHEIG